MAGITQNGGLPFSPGTYLLILRLPRTQTIRVGKIGSHRFPAGYHAYVGSAKGPGGLAARVGRHLKKEKPLRWHIDYLRCRCTPSRVWFSVGSEPAEHRWAQALAASDQAKIVLPRFGASDCRCPTHLFYFRRLPARDPVLDFLPESARCVVFRRSGAFQGE